MLVKLLDISISLVKEFLQWWVLKINLFLPNINTYYSNEIMVFCEDGSSKRDKSDFQSKFSMSRII